MTAVFRMSDDGWTADKAFAEMKQYKYGADFLHSEFKEFVYAYRPEIVPPARVPRKEGRQLTRCALLNSFSSES